MNYKYLDLNSPTEELIDGVKLHKLIVHKDESGELFETLRVTWNDVFEKEKLPFVMQYMSITPSGGIRDKNKWHVHKFQEDRFICASGKMVVAIYDPREGSRTKGKLNLFLMGPDKEQEMFMVLIPKETYHGFMVVSKEKGYLLNFPTQLYSEDDEGRVVNKELDWDKVREDLQGKND